MRVQGGEDFFELDFSQHLDLRAVQPQPSRAQCHLRAAFFAGHIQRLLPGTLQCVQRLQQEGGFADAGVAAYEHHAAFHNAATQNPVELVMAGGRVSHVGGLDVGQRREL